MKSQCLIQKQDGAVAGALTSLVFISVILLSLIFFAFGVVVPPGNIGVRQNYYSVLGLLQRGYAKDGLEPGLHWRVPGISTVFLLPKGFQFVNLHRDSSSGDYNRRELDVITADGSKVQADITLIVRLFQKPGTSSVNGIQVPEVPVSHPSTANDTIATTATPEEAPVSDEPTNLSTNLPATSPVATTQGTQPLPGQHLPGDLPLLHLPEAQEVKHGGPRDLVENYRDTPLKQLATFAVTAQNELNIALTKLTTTDFYDPVLREYAASVAHREINQKVNSYGIELWGTLIRRYTYAEKKIDDQIFAKNLQTQRQQFNKEASSLAAAKAETERQRTLWDAKIRTLEEEGKAKAAVIRSQGELYEASKQADGNLMVAKAKAAVDEARAKALSETQGADVYVAREMAPLLESLRGGVISGIDPFDINRWVEKLTAGKN